jgi:hypothetical protein
MPTAPAKTPGYSGTALAQKLGIKPGSRVFLAGAPEGYVELLEPLPSGVSFPKRVSRQVDLAQVFVTRAADLSKRLSVLRAALDPEAVIWVSWPKKSSKIPTEVTDNTIRDAALPLGLVDVKVCAVTDVWSGLKLVVRKELR